MHNMKLNPVSKREAARYMGIKGEPDENIQSLIDEAERNVREKINARYAYRVVSLSFSEAGVFAGDMELAGEDIRSHLEGCTYAVIMAATLTTDADTIIRQAGVAGAAEALAADCICSAAIEQVCDRAEDEIFSVMKTTKRTSRFSPGYGDFPLGFQKTLLDFLDAPKRIGLTVTESCMMIPTKSVTAVIGISDKELEPRKKGCAACKMSKQCGFSLCGNGNE